MKSIKLLIFALFIGIFASCGTRTIYSEYQPIPLAGWEADSVLNFTYTITDTLTPCDIFLSVRNSQKYAYQNLWLFVSGLNETPDTFEIYLADQRGVWLGSGWGNLRERTVVYMQNYIFPAAGEYTFTIQQGMRDCPLYGISDIGFIIQEAEHHGQE